ncbi:MAG: hypothetical protein HY774_11440 [Acidobacteria bacterium]|nr:hypothetical protein [Acidobacteriota bacterium]
MVESKGDTLQRILVFLGIGSCIFVLAVNGALFHSMRTREANTNGAIQTMRNFHSAQAIFSYGGKSNYAATESDLSELCPGNGSGFIPPMLVTMQRIPYGGYIMASIKTTPKTPNSEPTYSIVIVPQVQTGLFRTGDDCFYVDQTGEIRHSGSPTTMPDANSPLLQH